MLNFLERARSLCKNAEKYASTEIENSFYNIYLKKNQFRDTHKTLGLRFRNVFLRVK